MSSIREQVLEAVKAALAAPGTPATGGVFRSQLDQIKPSQLPCFDVSPGEEKIADYGEFGDNGSVTRKLSIMVRALVDAGTAEGEDANPNTVAVDDSALDPFYTFAIQQLAGNGGNLGGAVNNLEEISSAVVFQPAGRDQIGLEIQFDATFSTRRGDPAQRG